jgi:hypothetical protein
MFHDAGVGAVCERLTAIRAPIAGFRRRDVRTGRKPNQRFPALQPVPDTPILPAVGIDRQEKTMSIEALVEPVSAPGILEPGVREPHRVDPLQ